MDKNEREWTQMGKMSWFGESIQLIVNWTMRGHGSRYLKCLHQEQQPQKHMCH
jgi:hypothetical protein